MIVRWLLQVTTLLAAVVAGSLLEDVDTKLLSRRNVTEKTGLVCAYADFNVDRYTDVLHYHRGKLYVLLQEQRDFTAENDEDTQKWVIDLGEEPDEIACTVGDINGDGLHDVVVSTKKKGDDEKWTVRYFTSVRHENKDIYLNVKFQPGAKSYTAKDQVALIDVTGDGLHDMVGMHPNGSLMCHEGATGEPFVKTCNDVFVESAPENLRIRMPTLFGDVDNDRYAELIFMRNDDDGNLKPEIWKRVANNWSKPPALQLPPRPNGVSFKHTLAPLLADIDLDARMELIVPVCKDSTCTTLDSLQVTRWLPKKGNDDDNKEKAKKAPVEGGAAASVDDGQWDAWNAVAVDLGSQGNKLVVEADTLARMKVGDANLDGYPDLLVTMTVEGGMNYATVLENRPVGEDNNKRRFEKPTQMMIMPGLALGMVQSSSFFDFAEDGYLDVLVQWKLRDGDDWQWSLIISDPDKQGDVTFLKVQTFAPLPGDKDIKTGLGAVWGGVCASYEMETTGIGNKRRAIECQVTGNSHKAGLTPPFVLFGLGRNPNFVDLVDIGVPRPITGEEKFRWHQQKQIVPNARMMVQPPSSSSNGWVLRLYLTPSSLILSSFIVMASTCTILLAAVLILHFREKKVDRVERAAQSHRFHFDAM